MVTPSRSVDSKKRLKLNVTPLKEREINEPITPSSTPSRLIFGKESIYSRTKSLLQRSAAVTTNSGFLVSRKQQYDEIMNFLDTNVMSHQSNSLYITGPPGTGKTAQVSQIISKNFLPLQAPRVANEMELPKDLLNTSYFKLSNGKIEAVALTSINCIALNDASSIFNKIYSSFSKVNNTPVKTMQDLQRFMELYSEKVTFVVVLDEMDKLLRTSVNDTIATRLIFELFLLAKMPSINFLLIGIANSLDMKDKFLSRLNLRNDLLPKTLIFHPYSADEMYNIVMNRISIIEDDCIFNPMAIRFAAKRCSGNTGDLRKLFDVLRNSIEVVELELIASRKKSNKESKLTKVGMQHIAKVFNQVLNSTSTRSRMNKLNMQQRVMLCSLVHREKLDIFQSHISMDDAFDYYFRLLSKKDVLKPLKRNEFLEMCNTLETCGLVTIIFGKSNGKTKHTVKLIKTNVDEAEFQEEITKIDLLKNFMLI
ncbi:hypothetical protein KAFR_0F01580 [Kazachstania africana CBS 2517]|uniref:Cell division control protein n=1 Tax=Kazachstania africana (strain ATCC 22294 / BCRC 22015 / CBS 2517 / CECT 1963 / NBRC 1671 / NRRL Y-8276) TaxID=1071382 RepID=H2AWK5_KAZAF|nr:hypothetical protein KAFR_0F01580 [Kazachstania africana CBS 2517]CCF58755.1 hypothetical protein KAFR_0F01580 [Kazachstania africana CBS 2517]